jgi:cytochrome c556
MFIIEHGSFRQRQERDMLITMRKATILISALAFSAFGLFAQDELATYQASMKAAAGANGALRKAVTEKDSAAVTANAQKMADSFEQIAKFFQGKGKEDGVKFANAARDAAKSVAGGDESALAKIGPNCQGCHAVYRDGNKFKGL